MSKTDNYIIDLHNLQEEVKELKQDKEIIYETSCEIVKYLDENDYKIEPEKLDELIVIIQNYSR